MRVYIEGINACMEMVYAVIKGKRIYFFSINDTCYKTDEYFDENIARGQLGNLVVDGYLRVKELYTDIEISEIENQNNTGV